MGGRVDSLVFPVVSPTIWHAACHRPRGDVSTVVRNARRNRTRTWAMTSTTCATECDAGRSCRASLAEAPKRPGASANTAGSSSERCVLAERVPPTTPPLRAQGRTLPSLRRLGQCPDLLPTLHPIGTFLESPGDGQVADARRRCRDERDMGGDGTGIGTVLRS